MSRIVLENIFFFFLPTLLYLAYTAFKRNEWPGLWQVLREAPLVKLFVTGAALMIVTLVAFSSGDGHRPGEAYTPPSFDGGKLAPGYASPERK